ncbi:N-acetylglucosamine-6-phosphate deacetylase [Limnoglobus roseus]|uniref:N-acetylglucosamine 6-phosphate deacetylase n=1 Tax=Limnoglobus roseus TaxID=2598579 RepID=A0A5C1A7R6_9BACT|nr:amidohydrolase family protein [Limnoglobus roseus]QEL15349.1 N-acetylglucosamine 6-phosphate deacetylase [Limnoglobus roseus]
MILTARPFATGEPLALEVTAGRITALAPTADSSGLPWVAPSFFDPQINGCLGRGFVSPDLTPDDVRLIAETCRGHGIGRFCPTLITNSFDAIHRGFATLTRTLAADAELAAWLPCFHLEGPYLSGEDGARGAHPREHTRDPDWDEFRRWQDAADGRIRMVTVAPERAGALPFIERLTAANVVVAIGHTLATGEQIRDAVTAGAKTSTHLGNGCPAVLPRHDNPIWEQLACDELFASIIADGYHLPPAVVKCIVRMKADRVLLTCDAGTLAGLPPGRYRDWGTEMEVLPGGKIVVAGTQYLAGSGVFTDACVAGVMRLGGVNLQDAITMASVRPRELLGEPVPRIAVGERAELVLFDLVDGELRVRQVVG